MFGLIKPGLCSVNADQRTKYRRLYCGLCKGLGSHANTVSRLMVNHDTVFLATFIQAMVGEEGTRGQCRCPAMPWTHRAITLPETTEIEIATGLQLLLAAGWLQDKAEDGNLLAKGANPLGQRWANQGRACLARAGLDLEPAFTRLMAEQRHIESQPLTTPLVAAEPTAEFFAHFMRSLADLEAVQDDFKTASAKDLLGQLGYEIGMIVYLLDALKDLEQDKRRGHFNPCLATLATGATGIDVQRVRSCLERLSLALSQLGNYVNRLPWQRHEVLLNHLVRRRLGQIAVQEVSTCLMRNGLAAERSLIEFQPEKGRGLGLESCWQVGTARLGGSLAMATVNSTSTSLGQSWMALDDGLGDALTDVISEQSGDGAGSLEESQGKKRQKDSWCSSCNCDCCCSDCDCCGRCDGGCCDGGGCDCCGGCDCSC